MVDPSIEPHNQGISPDRQCNDSKEAKEAKGAKGAKGAKEAKEASEFIESFCSDGESIILGFDSVKSSTTSATSVGPDTKTLKHDSFKNTADTIRLGTAYSSQMLQCLDQMLSQENEDVTKTLDSLVSDILCSVPYNSYSVDLTRPRYDRTKAGLAREKN